MKRLSAALAACALIGSLVACGDSTGSSNSGGSAGKKYSVRGDEVRVTSSRTNAIVERDDANRTLTMVVDDAEDLCVVSGGSAEWRSVGDGADTLRYEYGFGALSAAELALVRDSLGLPVKKGIYLALAGSGDDGSAVFVGGDSSSVDGTWHLTGCVVVGGAIDCAGAELLAAFGVKSTVVRISSRSLVATTEQSSPKSALLGGDPFESEWAAATYGTLSGESGYVAADMSVASLFYVKPEKVAKTIEALGVEILTRDETTETFLLDGKEYRLQVNRMDAWIRDGGIGIEYLAEAYATRNGISCYIDGRTIVGIGKDDCIDENADSFRLDFTFVGEDEVDYAYAIRKDSGKNYAGCLKILPWPIVYTSSSSQAAVAPPPADASAKASLRKALRRKLPFLPRLSPAF